uniref:Uncharacterized protein n=2 Tax=Guillardia theta TaxID=55529 RepID=A0A7S4M0V1_GUITH
MPMPAESQINGNGMTAGNFFSNAFSATEGLPESFDQYRPPASFAQEDGFQLPPSFADAANFPKVQTKPAEIPRQTKLTGMPMKEPKVERTAYEPAPLPKSVINQARPKDEVFQKLMASMGGNDEIAPFQTPVIKERPIGVEPHMAAPMRQEDRGEVDEGEYEGEKEGGMRHGKGKCRYANGNQYIGEWVNNKRNNRGTMYFASSAVYDGEWLEGERSGHGVMKYSDGSTYEGQWLRDLKHGYGCYRFASKASYTGQWFEGRMHGQGTYEFADGQKFHGEFNRNLKSGYGTHVYRNGDQWGGIWIDDEPSGSGLYIFASNEFKVESPFVKAGEPPPHVGRQNQVAKVLRREDKLRMLQESESADEQAREFASKAAQVAAEARVKMYKVLDDTAQLLGLMAPNT